MTKKIEFSDDVLIQCPLLGFEYRKAKKCFPCEHYKGLMVATVNGKPIENGKISDMQILCGRPITRKLVQVTDE